MGGLRQRKIGKVIIGILILGLVVSMFFCFSMQNKQRILRQNENYVQDNAVQTADHIDDILQRSLKDIETISCLFGETLDEPVVTPDDLKELTEKSYFDYIRFTDLDGNNVTADGRTSDATDREYFQEGIAGKTGMSVTMRSRITNETLVNFYTPLRYKGEIIGVLRGVYLAEKRMQQLLVSSFFGEEAAAFLCLPDGTLIAGNGETDELPEDFQSVLRSGQYVDESCVADIEEAFETGKSTGFTFHTEYGTGNGYILKLESADWILVQTFPAKVTDAMYTEANNAGVILEASLVVLFLIYLVILIVSNHRQKKNLLEENRDMHYVVEGIPKLYDKFILVDLENGTYRYLMNHESGYRNLPVEGKYELLRRSVLQNVRDEDEKEQLGNFLNPDVIRKNVDINTHDIRMDYRTGKNADEWRRVNIVCLERKEDIPVKVLLARQNITEVKQAEIEKQNVLKEAMEAAENSNRAKSTFLFNMSHDIRTPMNAIIGFTNMAMKKTDDAETVRNYLDKIQRSSDVLLKIINDVLDMARIESGKSMIRLSPGNLQTEAESIRDMFAESMKEAGLTFSVEIDLQDSFVMFDKLWLSKIAINLINNAQKFTPRGGSVFFGIRQLGYVKDGAAEYEMTVRDTGIGMSEEFMSRMFEAFERERTSTVSGIQGTGLGLSIVKSLVDMMGGTIRVSSKQNVGTELVICLTMQVLQEEVEVKEPLSSAAIDCTGKRVFLVEDNELNREIAIEILKEEGFLVEEAEDGLKAVDRMKEVSAGYYDVILMDIQMPGMDGYEATRKIRAMEDTDKAKIPIVAMTANAFEEDKRAAMDAGMNGHIGKPVDVEKMRKVLAKVLKV